MVSSPSLFVRTSPVHVASPFTFCLILDTVDQILARMQDAGGFDETETVWLLSA